jgi:hypothetical protein
MSRFMQARIVLLATAALLGVVPGAWAQSLLPAAPEQDCHAAGEQAERAWNIPAGLLTAIGRMESGRGDVLPGRVTAWPWTVNANGQGAYFNSRAEAVAVVRSLQMRGVRSVDVGCFQINMAYHPDAFESLEQAFEPRPNANYAAQFLSELHDRTGSWETAVAWYHSATPGVGEPYRDRVLADWSGGGMRVMPASSDPGQRFAGAPLAWNVSAQVMGVRVWTPVRAAATARIAAVVKVSDRTPPRAATAPARRANAVFMPRVITPRG